MSGTKIYRIAVMAAVIAGGLAPGEQAGASTKPLAVEQHCVIEVTDVEDGVFVTQPEVCFAVEAEAAAHAASIGAAQPGTGRPTRSSGSNTIGIHYASTAYSGSSDRDLGSDLTAETFAVALASVERFNPAKGSPQQWLYGIANNQLKRLWRRNRVSSAARRRLQIQTPSTAATGWEEIEAADARLDADRLAQALDRVAPKSREAVRLRIIEQLDYTEIADTLGCRPGTARSLVMRGLRRLRDEFDAPPVEVTGHDPRSVGLRTPTRPRTRSRRPPPHPSPRPSAQESSPASGSRLDRCACCRRPGVLIA